MERKPQPISSSLIKSILKEPIHLIIFIQLSLAELFNNSVLLLSKI